MASIPSNIDRSRFRVRLFSSSAGEPDDQLAEFTNPQNFRTGFTTNSFNAPSGLELGPNTGYLLMTKGLGNPVGSIRTITSDNETGNPQADR